MIPDEIDDEYAKEARALWDWLRLHDFRDGRNAIARALRVAAEVGKIKGIREVLKYLSEKDLDELTDSEELEKKL